MTLVNWNLIFFLFTSFLSFRSSRSKKSWLNWFFTFATKLHLQMEQHVLQSKSNSKWFYGWIDSLATIVQIKWKSFRNFGRWTNQCRFDETFFSNFSTRSLRNVLERWETCFKKGDLNENVELFCCDVTRSRLEMKWKFNEDETMSQRTTCCLIRKRANDIEVSTKRKSTATATDTLSSTDCERHLVQIWKILKDKRHREL